MKMWLLVDTKMWSEFAQAPAHRTEQRRARNQHRAVGHVLPAMPDIVGRGIATSVVVLVVAVAITATAATAATSIATAPLAPLAGASSSGIADPGPHHWNC